MGELPFVRWFFNTILVAVLVTLGTVLIDASGATLMATVVMDYIAQQGGAKTQVEGRITTP